MDETANENGGHLHLLRHEPDPGFIALLRGEVRGGQARATKALGWFDLELPVGAIRVVHDEQLVHLVTNDLAHFDAHADEELGFEPPYRPSERVREELEQVFGGERRGSDIAYLGSVRGFARGVLEATARIPRGEVRPYAWTAREAGSPQAVRAAGTALAHNPVPFVVPCHRVVRSDWSLGQYSAGGTSVKERILSWEGVDTGWLTTLAGKHLLASPEDGTYCLPVCPGLFDNDPVLIPFRRAEDAEAAGFRACGHCRPA